jgi:HEPN domain-containing protein
MTINNTIYNPLTNWDNSSLSVTTDTIAPYIFKIDNNDEFHLKGTLSVDGNIKSNGHDLGYILSKIEERLNILTPNIELESKWEELKKLGDQYRKLEKSIMEKEKLYSKLKN